MFKAITFLALLSLLSPGILDAAAPLIPLRDFFRNSEKSGYQISPDGKYFSFLAPFESRMNIHLQPVEGEEAPIRLTSETDRDIFSYFWTSPTGLVYLQDTDGDENTHLYSVDTETLEVRPLTPFEGTRVQVVDDLENDPEHMLISMNQRDPRLFDVFKINLLTGELELQVENPGNYIGYVTDNAGDIRFATAADGVNSQYFYRKTKEDPFELVMTTDWRRSFSPVKFTYDDQKVWVASNLGRDKTGLILWNPETREEEELIFSHPQVDLHSAHFSDKKEKLVAVSFIAAYRTFVYFDEEMERIIRGLEEQLPGMNVRVSDWSKDETKWLVLAFSDRHPGSYYFYDKTTDELQFLTETKPWLNPEHLATMEPVSYESRDGLFIHGYLTLPSGIEPKNLPTVVIPHGGPQSRDTWGFRPEAQFLANRGYAVLQVNFRGSTGYGLEFMDRGLNRWGLEVQNDITDGVHYLIKQGVADPERIGIYGASFGGYATLAGLTFTPELYAAGVSYVGPSNIFTLLESIPPYWEPFLEMAYEQVGHPEKDKEQLVATSPLFHVDQIQAPLMIFQGANDPRVKQAESDQIVAALSEKGIDVPYMLKADEGHGFTNEENRFESYRALEQFFAKHLGGRIEEGKDILSTLYGSEAHSAVSN